jgi:hypothetical protein
MFENGVLRKVFGLMAGLVGDLIMSRFIIYTLHQILLRCLNMKGEWRLF